MQMGNNLIRGQLDSMRNIQQNGISQFQEIFVLK